jgi:phage gpG-like protein
MPDAQITEGIDKAQQIEKAYDAINYYAMKLSIDLQNGRKDGLRSTFEELRYGFVGMYAMVRHHPELNPKLKKEIDKWRKTRTGRTGKPLPSWYYRYTLNLYERFIDNLALIGLVK